MALCKFRNVERFSMTNKQSAEHKTPRLLRNMAFLKLRKSVSFQMALRFFGNDNARAVPLLILLT
jgi:hypothetical protein